MVVKSEQIFSSVLSQSTRLTDRQTDGQTAFSSLDRVCTPCSVVKKETKKVHGQSLWPCSFNGGTVTCAQQSLLVLLTYCHYHHHHHHPRISSRRKSGTKLQGRLSAAKRERNWEEWEKKKAKKGGGKGDDESEVKEVSPLGSSTNILTLNRQSSVMGGPARRYKNHLEFCVIMPQYAIGSDATLSPNSFKMEVKILSSG